MNSTAKNILAVIVGIIVGSVVNMAIIMISGSLIPPPEGVNPADMESLAENIHLFEAQHFIMPFLAHAIGTLLGAFLATKIAATHKANLAMAVGIFFFIGGVANAFMLPAPTWFITVDLIFAYIPMAWIGLQLATGEE